MFPSRWSDASAIGCISLPRRPLGGPSEDDRAPSGRCRSCPRGERLGRLSALNSPPPWPSVHRSLGAWHTYSARALRVDTHLGTSARISGVRSALLERRFPAAMEVHVQQPCPRRATARLSGRARLYIPAREESQRRPRHGAGPAALAERRASEPPATEWQLPV